MLTQLSLVKIKDITKTSIMMKVIKVIIIFIIDHIFISMGMIDISITILINHNKSNNKQ